MSSIKERIQSMPFPLDTHAGTTGTVKRVRGTRRARLGVAMLTVAALAFMAAGSYAIVRGWDARGQVRDQLVAQQIVTPEDASIPNALVEDDATAMAQADIIEVHALEATGGKTYAQMDREDPARQIAFSASALRTALLSAVLAWNTANLVMAFGAFVVAIGVLLALSIILFAPRFQRS